jgi:ATP-binding cassette, subfamily B, bacterial
MADPAPAPKKLRPLRGLLPFIAPYKRQVAIALLFLVLAASATLAMPYAVRLLVDNGLAMPAGSELGDKLVAIRGHFGLLFAVAVALGVFTAARFFMVTWIGERVTADLRHAVYAHVLTQSPQFFETLKTGEVLSRLTTDTTVIQNAVGSSISMGLRNAVLFVGGIAMLIATSPRLMLHADRRAGAAAVAREPGSNRRFKRDRRRSAERGSGSAELHAGARRDTPILRCERARFRDVDPAHRHAGPADGVPDRRSLRFAALRPVRRGAGGHGGTHQRR